MREASVGVKSRVSEVECGAEQGPTLHWGPPSQAQVCIIAGELTDL
jgi:hypothetical protein